MGLLFSLLALGISLIALWMASTAMRRSEGSMSAFIMKARKELGSTKVEIDQSVGTMASRLEGLEKQVTAFKADTGKTATSAAGLQAELASLHKDLSALDASIPKQYKNPTPRTSRSHIAQ